MEFRKGQTGYIIMKNMYGVLKSHVEHSVGLKAFHITKVGREYVDGFVIERFGDLSGNGIGHNIITKKKKKKGVEIPFQPHDSVAIGKRLRINHDVFTFEQGKLELIKYIANDFSDPEDYNEGE